MSKSTSRASTILAWLDTWCLIRSLWYQKSIIHFCISNVCDSNRSRLKRTRFFKSKIMAENNESAENLFVSPPDQFILKIRQHGPAWKKRFTRYASVTELGTESEAKTIEDFICTLSGRKARLFFSVSTTTENLRQIVAGFWYFLNFFLYHEEIERFKFNSRVKQQYKLLHAFITDVHAMANQCAFWNFKDDLICDRIVVGMLNTKLIERLQVKQDLTLQKTINVAKQEEIQHKQNQIIIRDNDQTEHQFCSARD